MSRITPLAALPLTMTILGVGAVTAPPPRPVAAAAGEETLLLLPGSPAGRILVRSGRSWTTLIDDLPAWATSAALVDDRLLLLGGLQGKAHVQARPAPGPTRLLPAS